MTAAAVTITVLQTVALLLLGQLRVVVVIITVVMVSKMVMALRPGVLQVALHRGNNKVLLHHRVAPKAMVDMRGTLAMATLDMVLNQAWAHPRDLAALLVA